MAWGAYIGVRPDGCDARRAFRAAQWDALEYHVLRCARCRCDAKNKNGNRICSGFMKNLPLMCKTGAKLFRAWIKAEGITPLPRPKGRDFCPMCGCRVYDPAEAEEVAAMLSAVNEAAPEVS